MLSDPVASRPQPPETAFHWSILVVYIRIRYKQQDSSPALFLRQPGVWRRMKMWIAQEYAASLPQDLVVLHMVW